MIPPLYKWYPMVAAPEYPTKKDALERDRQIELEKKTAKAKEEEVRLKEASAKKAEEEKEKMEKKYYLYYSIILMALKQN